VQPRRSARTPPASPDSLRKFVHDFGFRSGPHARIAPRAEFPKLPRCCLSHSLRRTTSLRANLERCRESDNGLDVPVPPSRRPSLCLHPAHGLHRLRARFLR
jgi:hypothetical protein